MQRLTSDEQLEQIWNAAIEEGIAPIRTTDSYGDPFVIFDDWNEVENIYDLTLRILPKEVLDEAPIYPTERLLYPAHHIEWAIGEFGFSDQFQTCSNCYVAIDTEDYNPDHWWSEEGYLCGDCTRKNSDWADDYLTYLASHLEEHSESVITRLAQPDDHGFVCINSTSAQQYVRDECNPDHPAYDSRLTYADHAWLHRLGKAARLVDPNLQFVYTQSGGANLIFARWNPNESAEYATVNGYKWSIGDSDTNGGALGYAIGRVMVKWAQLQEKVGWAR